MSKQNKLLNALTTEKRVTHWKMHKRKKVFVAFAGVLAIGLGTAGFVYVNAQSTSSLPTNTTVNWENNKPLYYEIDQTGKEHPKPMLKLADGTTPAWCLGLGVPLPNNTTQAQLDSTNAIFNALSDEQIAVLNNVNYLAQKDGSLLAYAQAQHATYLILDEAGLSENQTKDVVVKDNTLLHDANAIKTGATDLINQAKKMCELPSFNGSTVDLVQGVEKTVTDSKAVLANFPNFKNNLKGLTESVSGNNLKLKADISSKIGLNSNALQYWNVASFDNLPYFVYSTDGDSTGKSSQSVFATQDPSKANGSLNVRIIGLGEIIATKVSANSKFDTKLMAGAEYSFFYKDGSPVKWTDGQSGYPITPTNGAKANNTNVVLKVGNDGKFGVKNLQNDKAFYFVETKAPAGFVLDDTKHAFSFDKNSSFNVATSNYHVDGESKEIPTGSTTLQKLDADTNTTVTQGEAKWDGIVYGLFNTKDDSPVKWTDGLKSLPIAITNGKKANNTNVELSLDKDNKVGIQNLNLANNDDYYWKEVRTSEGYSLSTKKIPIKFTGKESVDVTTNDFSNNQHAQNKVLAFQLRFWKAQSVNDSLTGLDGAGFTMTPQSGTKGKAIKAVSKSSIDSDGFTKNGFVLFDGKANLDAGNANPDGIAIGDYLLEETTVPKDTQAINPISITTTPELNKDGSPKSYTVVLKDTVTGQKISSTTIGADKVTDNNLMFKIDLGTLTDKPTEKVKPTIKTQAHTKDGDKIIQINEVSEKTAMYDIADFTNIEKGDRITSKLHRLVTDKDGKVTSDKVVQTLKFTADDETVKSQQHRFDTIADTTKDFDIPDGSTVTYVFTEDIVDKDADSDTGKPEATHDDLKDQDQTLTVEKVTSSIDIEKANNKTPDAGNGNYSDKDNNIGVNDHDIEDTYFEVKENAKTEIFFRGTNNGDEPLTHVKIVDKTTNGKIDVKDITYTYNGKKLTINNDGEFELNGKLLVFNPKESIIGSGELGALPDGELHGDKATITGVGVYSKKKVGDDDKWYGKVVKVTPKISTTPLSTTLKGKLPTTGSETGDVIAYGGAVAILVALGTGAVYYMKKKKSGKEEG